MSFISKYLLLFGFILFIFNGCSKNDNPVQPVNQTNLSIKTLSSSDSSIIQAANVILFNANNGEAVSRLFSNQQGIASFQDIQAGNYFVKISAQGFNEVPVQNLTPIPFSVLQDQSQTINYYLDPYTGNWGKIDGTLNPAVPGVLICAYNQVDNSIYQTYSGPDGYFVFFNLSYGSYKITAIKASYYSDSTYNTNITNSTSSKTININIKQDMGSTLKGAVTFLAVTNGIVDISILDKQTMAAVNGLSTIIDSARNYKIQNIPQGNYIAWASYKNDGYVMDPDWIFKNPGALEINFSTDSSTSLNFSVTNAINLISPTNNPDTILPVSVDSLNPVFTWSPYPQAKEYIIEVKDLNGNIIWGGFDENGIIRHAKISKETTSVKFNFDGSAKSLLKRGEVYQWKVYADDNALDNVQTLLSSSEDLMGLFKVK
ncbi:MAG: carboxypeptidase-like regulatory domain-containing protein [Ignavibacteriaceae bacterium]